MTDAPTTRETADHEDYVMRSLIDAHGQWEIENRNRGPDDGQLWQDGHVRLLARAAIIAADQSTLLSEIAALRGEREADMQAMAEAGQNLQSQRIAITQAERQRDDMAKALLSLAEGNLGDEPWQANYETIKQVARNAIANQGADQ